MPEFESEQDLYEPVKAYLEAQGYEVKGEVGACDMVARRGDEPCIIVELKLRFNLDVILQAVDRLNLSDNVYMAVPKQAGSLWKKRRKQIKKLSRMLGLGLMTVQAKKSGAKVEVLLDPGPYQPRISNQKNGRLLKEFHERVGDPNIGGTTGVKRVTAYRQDALRLVSRLSDVGRDSPKNLKAETGVERAAAILQDNHYGWFERVERGVYQLSPKGNEAKTEFSSVLKQLG